MATPELSVVVPSYGCLNCLEELCTRLTTVLTTLVQSFEIVIVDDRSPDNSWPVIEAISARYDSVRGIRLSRNFGQHLALTAGVAATKGRYVVVMDCDLQDPPERIPDLYHKVQKGYDLVLAKRIERSHSAFRLIAAKAYFSLMRRISNKSLDGSYGTFSIMSRKVADAFLRFKEPDRHFLFILRWLGFNCGTIEYPHGDRHSGKSSYNLARLIRHAANGFFFQTSILLSLIMYAGFFFTALSFAVGLFFIYRYITSGAVPGWTSIFVSISFSTGLILASVGAVGLYVSRIFELAKGRPIYVIDEECGCKGHAEEGRTK